MWYCAPTVHEVQDQPAALIDTTPWWWWRRLRFRWQLVKAREPFSKKRCRNKLNLHRREWCPCVPTSPPKKASKNKKRNKVKRMHPLTTSSLDFYCLTPSPAFSRLIKVATEWCIVYKVMKKENKYFSRKFELKVRNVRCLVKYKLCGIIDHVNHRWTLMVKHGTMQQKQQLKQISVDNRIYARLDR